ncbi:MAG: hypothetical protein NVV74_02550 [Magnetospirillum sp.]|nr:hypothetical protein [Magnetospirillum sp.]
MLVQWQKDFESGHPAADAEHREVVDLLNELDVCLATGAAPAIVDRTLEALIRALARHLAHEQDDSQPELAHIYRLHQDWLRGTATIDRAELRALAHWWLIHLCGHDGRRH